MAQLVVRNLDPSIKLRLQRRARRNGRSMEEEVRDILRDATKRHIPPLRGLGTDIASLFTECGLDSDIAELRGGVIKPPSFGR